MRLRNHTMKKSILILCFVALVGCAKSNVPDGLPKLVPVTLTLMQEGAPLSEAVVSLEGDTPFSVGGVTDAKGSVILYTSGKYKGAPPGKFKVRVMKTESDPTPSAPKPGDPEFRAYMEDARNRSAAKTYTLVEKQYTQIDTTPLELDITGPLTQTLDVGKAVKETP